MEIRDLRYFCLTAELEHVSKAAEKLGVSQPFLTKVIGQLENELGTPLFDNVGRRIKLNRYGEVFYERAKKILADIEGLMDEIDDMLGRQEKVINFLSDTAGYTSDIMLEYKKAFPENMMSITYDKRDRIIEAITTGSADYALCTPPITEDESKMIKTEIVYEDCGCVLLPPGHRLIGKGPLDLSALEGEPLVTSPKGAGVRNNLELIFESCGYVPNVVCESNDMDLLIKAVLGGLGFAFMPHRLINDPQLRPYCAEISAPKIRAQIGLSCNKNNFYGKSAEEFRDFIKTFFDALKDRA